eukprot:2818839-Amphidinium_carterae.1
MSSLPMDKTRRMLRGKQLVEIDPTYNPISAEATLFSWEDPPLMQPVDNGKTTASFVHFLKVVRVVENPNLSDIVGVDICDLEPPLGFKEE